MKNEEIRNVAKLGRTGTGPRHSQLFFHAHNMSQCCTISFVKHWHTHSDTHTPTRTHTQHTVAYTCLCLPYNKAYKAYNGARVPQTRIHTSATHAHMLALVRRTEEEGIGKGAESVLHSASLATT